MPERRHLKVVGAAAGESPGPTRSRGHWLLLGGLSILVLWLPLAMVGLWGSRLLAAALAPAPGADLSRVSVGLLQLLWTFPILGSFVGAAYLGGLLLARFGSLRARGDLMVAGGCAGGLVTSLAAVQGALQPWQLGAIAYVVMVSVGALSAAWGGGRGARMYYADSVSGPPPS